MDKLKNFAIAVGTTLAAIACFLLIPVILSVLSFVSICFCIFCIYKILEEDAPIDKDDQL